MFDVKPSLLRHWEAKFDILKPKKNKKGNRLFTPEDVENLKLIYHLVKERGLTLDGAARALRANRGELTRDAELLERLQRIRAQLVEVREELKGDAAAVVGEEIADDAAAMEAAAADPATTDVAAADAAAGMSEPGDGERAAVRPRRSRPVVRIDDPADHAGAPGAPGAADPAAGAVFGEEQAGVPARKRRRRGREGDAEPKELFAFYEQSLF